MCWLCIVGSHIRTLLCSVIVAVPTMEVLAVVYLGQLLCNLMLKPRPVGIFYMYHCIFSPAFSAGVLVRFRRLVVSVL